jgi:hypothetical protein
MIERRLARVGLAVHQRQDPRDGIGRGVRAIMVFRFDRGAEESAFAELRAVAEIGLEQRRTLRILLAAGDRETSALGRVVEDDVDDSRHRIRAVLRGRAVAEHFDAAHSVGRDQVDIDWGRTA